MMNIRLNITLNIKKITEFIVILKIKKEIRESSSLQKNANQYIYM